MQGAGPDGVYNEVEIGPDGSVPALVTLDDKVKVGDTLLVTDKDGNTLLERPVTQGDLDNGVIVEVPVAPGDTDVSVTAKVTDPAGNSGTDDDEKPVDNDVPGVTVELQGAGPDGVYNEVEIGPDGSVPALVTLDDKVKVGDTLLVTDKDGNTLLERPVTQGDLDNGVIVEVPVAPGDTDVSVTAKVTDPAGNSGTDDDDKPVDNVLPMGTVPNQVDEDSDVIDLDLAGQISDNSGGPLTYSASGLPDGLSIDPSTGKISGTIDRSASQNGPNDDGLYPVIVTVTDPAGNSTDITFTWTVANPVPLANDDNATTPEDTPVSGNVLTGAGSFDPASATDSDPDGDPLTVTSFVVAGDPGVHLAGSTATIPGIGTLELNHDGSYTFTPDQDWNGTVPVVTYSISDGEGGTDTAELVIVVTPVNDAPVAEPPATPLDQTNLDADSVTTVTLDLPNLFSDVDGDTLIYSIAGLPPGLSFDPLTGQVTGTIDRSASQGGPDSDGVYHVTLTATDQDGEEATQTFAWAVSNPPPLANDDNVETLEDTPVSGNVLTGASSDNPAGSADSDPDGDPLTVTTFVVAGDPTVYDAGSTATIPGVGTLELNPDGAYTFTPEANWNGTVPTVTYTISDGEGGTDTAELVIVVTPVDDPILVDVPTDHTASTPDGKIDDQVVFESGLVHGSNPDDDDITVDASFTISALDGLASVTIGYTDASGDPASLVLSATQVEALGTANQTIATEYGNLVLDGYSLGTDGIITIDYTYTLVSAPQVSGTHTSDNFTITAEDADGDEESATLVIRIVDDAPLAVSDINAISEDATAPVIGELIGGTAGAGQDTEGADGATVSKIVAGTDNTQMGSTPTVAGIFVTGQYGSLTLHADGSYSYQLDNVNLDVQGLIVGEQLEEVFTYTLTDADGDSSVATLTIIVNGTNDGVTVDVPNDNTVTTPDGNTGDQVVFESGLGNGSNPDDDDITVDASFTISALDGLAPNGAVTIDYIDVNGDPASLVLSKAQVEALGTANQTITTEYGNLVLDGYSLGIDGIITIDYTYTLVNAPQVSGTHVNDVFTIGASDRDGDSSITQNLTIKIVDDSPQAVSDINSVSEDATAPVTGELIGGASGGAGQDTEGADGATVGKVVAGTDNTQAGTAPTVAGVNVTGQYGTLTLHADGSYSYQLDNANLDVQGLIVGEELEEVFTYTLTDADGDDSVATLTITVNGTNDGVEVDVPTDHTASTPDGKIDDQVVFESGLSNGSNPSFNDTVVDASFTVSALDGLASVTIGYTDASGDPASLVLSATQVEALGTANQTVTTEYGTLVLDGYSLGTDGIITIDYTYTLVNAPTVAGDDTSDSFAITAQDRDGDDNSQALNIKIVDDAPVASDQNPIILGEGGQTVGTATGEANLRDNDTLGADGARVHRFKYIDVDGVEQESGPIAAGDFITVITLDGGSLTVHSDGDWSYTSPPASDTGASAGHGAPGSATDDNLAADFQYQLIDGDGDVSGWATQPITVTDTEPNVAGTPPAGIVEEKYLPNGSTPDAGNHALGASGALGVVKGADAIDVTFPGTLVAPAGLSSGGVQVVYVVSADGHTLSATAGSGGPEVFTVTITDPHSEAAAYEFILAGALDHVVDDDEIELSFPFVVTDADGDTAPGSFSVTVVDDAPVTAKAIEVDEDASVSFTTSADATGNNISIESGDGPQHGTVTVNPDGSITYVPAPDYSGADSFTYTTRTDHDSVGQQVTVTVTVNPLADAPALAHDASTDGGASASVSTPEDNDVTLGLKLPVITDNADQNGSATLGDHPERLGAITLTLSGDGAMAGAILTKADGTPLVASGGSYTIVIVETSGDSDVDTDLHVSDGLLTGAGVNYLTAAEYEALKATPAEHHHENFTVGVSVTSYEVDDSGVKLVDVEGATSTQTITVYVQAVTDDAQLLFDTSVTTGTNIDGVSYTGNTEATVTLKEDTDFNVKDILSASFQDLDGSEVRSITVTNNTGQAILVNGTQLAVGASRDIPAQTGSDGQTGDIASFPAINIGAVGDYSGDLNGIGIRINAQDKDADGFQGTPGNSGNPPNGVVEADTSNNSVILNLHITPVAGDVAAGNVTTEEDTAVAFLQHVQVTDTGTGTEVIDKVAFEIPSGWQVTEPTNNGGWSVSGDGSTGDPYTITFDGSLSEAQREAVLDGFMIKPPAHSSKDAEIILKVTSTDTNGTDSHQVEDQELSVRITVTPLGERVDSDSNGQNGNDVTMSGDHLYTDHGKEDEWFELNSEGFDLKTPWSNEDGNGTVNGGPVGGSEETFARFTPYTNADEELDGSYFQYSDGADWITVPYNGSPVDIPIEYLDTVQFKGPHNFKGVVKIKVEAVTIDHDEDDNNATNTQVSGESWLTNLILDPVADQVTLKVDARITAYEDAGRDGSAPIQLNIRPTSDDPSETFNITIKGIPDGASITYDGVTYAVGSGLTPDGNGSYQLELIDFDNSKQPTLIPPKDSNQTINLSVEAVSVDTLTYIDKDGIEQTITSSPSAAHILPITVTLLGVPDEPSMTIDNDQVYVEDNLDNNGNQVELRELITSLASGETSNDGSETITLRISGLADGFSVVGAGPVVGNASGTDRVWVVTPAQIADGSVKIQVPANYSGTVQLTAQPVVTESDNPSETFFAPQNVEFQVTSSPEAQLNMSSSMIEDQLGRLDLSPDYKNGDTDEEISAVRIEAVDGVTFYSDAAGTQPLVAVGGWYEISGVDAVKSIHAKAGANFSGDIVLNVQYKVTDTAQDGTTGPVESGWQNTSHTLEVQPVTDPVDLALTAINGQPGAAYLLTAEGTVTVSLDIAKEPDANAGNARDYDGSERLTHILIQGVPNGMAVQGGIFTGAGQWLLPVGEQFNGDIAKSIVFSVNGNSGALDNVPITITVVTRDGNAESTEEASITWYLSTDFALGEEGKLPTVTLGEIIAPQSEDGPFTLDQVVSATVDTSGADQASFDMTITLRTAPGDGTTFPGMTQTEAVENGQPVVLWTTTVTGVTNATVQDVLNNALAGITVIPPTNANGNANNLGGDLPLDVTVTLHNNGVHSEGHVEPQVELAPVTDKATVSIVAAPVTEGEPIDIAITVSNPADQGGDWSVVDGKLYLQLDGTGIPGELSQGAAPLALQDVSGVPGLSDGQYYVIDGVTPDTVLNLTYTPAGTHDSGSVQLQAWVQNQENGGAAMISAGQGNLTVNPTNTAPEVTIAATGTEHDGVTKTQAQLNITGTLLPDSGETLQSAFIEGLPKDFTVWYGNNADGSGAVLASNAGGSTTNTWSIPVSGNALPAYIGIQAPAHWSGTLEDLRLYLVSGEPGNEPTAWPVEFDLSVAPQADGIELRPTLSFGTAGEVIALNLNAEMKDPVAVNANDSHHELTTLELSGFPDGSKVVFYADGVELVSTYDADTNQHTLAGLTQEQLNGLGFLHLGTGGVKDITVTAWTQEVDASGNPVGVVSSEASTTLQINVADKLPTNNADNLLWSGEAIDGRGGEDTIQLRYGESLSGTELASNLRSIEVLDLSAKGANAITGLTAQDVLDIAGGNLLTILGDDEDSVALGSGWMPGADVNVGGDLYHAYTNGAATLYVQEHVQVID
ncbi:hypothetical protein DNJ99_23640 [Pseudomonas daroniae]|nr:hypothetical protein DNK31_23750 [Pseudomonas sp. FRB 228]TBU86741.1 hypothetical protein DNJ99_23640 [Pseudomonas daroniae]